MLFLLNKLTQPNSSSYLIFTPSISNGTASYAMASKAIVNTIVDYGVFLAYTQSVYKAQLDDVDVFWSTHKQLQHRLKLWEQ